jgi:hypothetical protein
MRSAMYPTAAEITATPPHSAMKIDELADGASPIVYTLSTIMQNLVDEFTLLRVRNNLLQSKNIQNLHGSWWFNVAMLLVIAVIMVFFLMTQYTTTKDVIQAKESRKDIPRQELTWNNAVRNHIDL